MSINFERWGETILGAVVAAVAIGFFAFAAAQAGQTGGVGAQHYDLIARFQRVDGIGVGSDVRVSGVKVGVVRAIELDPDTYMAKLTFTLDRQVQIADESTARISTDGLLGGAYVAIEPAGMDPLPPGGEIPYTQGAVDLLTVLASFARQQTASNTTEPATP